MNLQERHQACPYRAAEWSRFDRVSRLTQVRILADALVVVALPLLRTRRTGWFTPIARAPTWNDGH